MKKRDFETYQKRFRDFEILPKFSETHVFWGTIRHPLFFFASIPKLSSTNFLNGLVILGQWIDQNAQH